LRFADVIDAFNRKTPEDEQDGCNAEPAHHDSEAGHRTSTESVNVKDATKALSTHRQRRVSRRMIDSTYCSIASRS
jgi:hypothetical protein